MSSQHTFMVIILFKSYLILTISLRGKYNFFVLLLEIRKLRIKDKSALKKETWQKIIWALGTDACLTLMPSFSVFLKTQAFGSWLLTWCLCHLRQVRTLWLRRSDSVINMSHAGLWFCLSTPGCLLPSLVAVEMGLMGYTGTSESRDF